jgi:hypothetical protein
LSVVSLSLVIATTCSDGHGYGDPSWVMGMGHYGTGMDVKILPHDVPIPVWVGDGSVTDLVWATCHRFRHSRSSLPPHHQLKFDGEG